MAAEATSRFHSRSKHLLSRGLVIGLAAAIAGLLLWSVGVRLPEIQELRDERLEVIKLRERVEETLTGQVAKQRELLAEQEKRALDQAFAESAAVEEWLQRQAEGLQRKGLSASVEVGVATNAPTAGLPEALTNRLERVEAAFEIGGGDAGESSTSTRRPSVVTYPEVVDLMRELFESPKRVAVSRLGTRASARGITNVQFQLEAWVEK